jgi:tRNA pseudouridine13 synthase
MSRCCSESTVANYLTPGIAGTGGIIKETADDFMVAELPLYQPCGDGEHVYAEIEKRHLTTLEAIRRLAGALGVPERDIGYAGLKDARGVTRQTISIPRVTTEQVLAVHLPNLRVLKATRHRNKLKPGHLAGNRFRITLRGTVPDAPQLAAEVLDVLARRGVPNFFGPQRYGSQGNSHLVGRALLLGDARGAVDAIIGVPEKVYDERWKGGIDAYRRGDLAASLRLFPPGCRTERELVRRLLERPGNHAGALRAVHPRLIDLYFSAWQSALFDQVLAKRLADCDRVQAGDLAWKHSNGACFLVTDPVAEAPRAASGEISPSGPLFGPRMAPPEGEPRAIEAEVLAGEGLTMAGPAGGWPKQLAGARRPLRVPVAEPSAAREEDALVLEFSLLKGAYATAVLREVMKDW